MSYYFHYFFFTTILAIFVVLPSRFSRELHAGSHTGPPVSRNVFVSTRVVADSEATRAEPIRGISPRSRFDRQSDPTS